MNENTVRVCVGTNVQDRCREYAVITEPLNGLRLVVCGLSGYQRHQHVYGCGLFLHSQRGQRYQRRHQHVYTSRSNVVRIQMAAKVRVVVRVM